MWSYVTRTSSVAPVQLNNSPNRCNRIFAAHSSFTIAVRINACSNAPRPRYDAPRLALCHQIASMDKNELVLDLFQLSLVIDSLRFNLEDRDLVDQLTRCDRDRHRRRTDPAAYRHPRLRQKKGEIALFVRIAVSPFLNSERRHDRLRSRAQHLHRWPARRHGGGDRLGKNRLATGRGAPWWITKTRKDENSRVAEGPIARPPPPSSNRACRFPAHGLPKSSQSKACIGSQP
jgi:hypothetical protein